MKWKSLMIIQTIRRIITYRTLAWFSIHTFTFAKLATHSDECTISKMKFCRHPIFHRHQEIQYSRWEVEITIMSASRCNSLNELCIYFQRFENAHAGSMTRVARILSKLSINVLRVTALSEGYILSLFFMSRLSIFLIWMRPSVLSMVAMITGRWTIL